MTKVLISLVGDQTVPNVFLIRDAAFRQMDHYVFVTTPLMEERQRLEHILAATGIGEGQYSKIEVQADNPHQIQQQLHELKLLRHADHCYVNLTSGTKVMSLALYAYFTQSDFTDRSSIFYIPIGGNAFLQIFPENAFQEQSIKYRIGVGEYLTSYGIKIIEQSTDHNLHRPVAYTASLMDYFTSVGDTDRAFAQMMKRLRMEYGKKEQKPNFDIPIWQELQHFLQQIRFEPSAPGRLQKAEIQYLIGGWLEEWTYQQIKTRLNLPDEAIFFQVKVSRNNEQGTEVPNECDVLFTYNNTLHLVECKTGITDTLFYNSVYKIAALRQEFGQRVNALFVTLSDLRTIKDGQLKEKYANRASLHRIALFDRKGIRQEFPAHLDKIALL